MAKNIQNKQPYVLTQDQAFAENSGLVPPSNLEVEQSVLGALIIDEDALVNNITLVSENYFLNPNNKEIFITINSLWQSDKHVDLLSVTEQLKKRDSFEAVGGSYYLASLVSRVVSVAHIQTYVKILAEKAIQREIIRVSTQGLKFAYSGTTDIIELLDSLSTEMLTINDSNLNSREKSVNSLTASVLDEILNPKPESDRALPSGYIELDNITGGFAPGSLTILAARPAMGKTAFALNIARNIAMQYNKAVAVFSLEMTGVELTMRLISSEAEIEGQKLKRADQLTNSEIDIIKEKSIQLGASKMYIDDNPGLNVMELKAKCKRMKKSYDIQMIFIDYLQLMSGSDAKNTNREQEISYISRQLKSLAKELNIPVFALSQLSRDVEKRGGSKMPMLSDLRESGAIEQDADLVMFIYRPEYYGELEDENGSTTGIAYINVAKNRAGSTAKARLGFIGKYVKFYNVGTTNENTYGNNSFDSATNNVIVRDSKANMDINKTADSVDNTILGEDNEEHFGGDFDNMDTDTLPQDDGLAF